MGQGDEYNNDRQTTGFWIGTVAGTVFTMPVNYSAYIFGFRYSAPFAATGTIGTIGADVEMRTYRLGTLTGTIDALIINQGTPVVRDGFGTNPVSRIEAGDSLVSIIVTIPVAGSVEGIVGWRAVPGRLSGP